MKASTYGIIKSIDGLKIFKNQSWRLTSHNITSRDGTFFNHVRLHLTSTYTTRIRTNTHLSKEHTKNFATYSHLFRNSFSRTERPLGQSISDSLRFVREIRNQTYHHSLLLPQITILTLKVLPQIFLQFLQSSSPSAQTKIPSPLLLSYTHTNDDEDCQSSTPQTHPNFPLQIFWYIPETETINQVTKIKIILAMKPPPSRILR